MRTLILFIVLMAISFTEGCFVSKYSFAKDKTCKDTFRKINQFMHKDKDVEGRIVYYVNKQDSLLFTKLIMESGCFTGILYSEAVTVFGKPTNKDPYGGSSFEVYCDKIYKKQKLWKSNALFIFIPSQSMFVKGVVNKNVKGVELMLVTDDGKYGIRFK